MKERIGFTALKAVGLGGVFGLNSYLQEEFKGSPATVFGTAVHSLLAGEEFDTESSIIPDARIKAGSRPWKEEEVERLHRLVSAAFASGLVPSGDSVEFEKDIFFEDEDFLFRAKPDAICKETKTIWDFKTASLMAGEYLNAKKATRIIADRFYHAQLAYYSSIVSFVEGWLPQRYIILFLNSSPRKLGECEQLILETELDHTWIEAGVQTIQDWKEKLYEVKRQDFKPQKKDISINLEAPKWIL